MFKKKPLDPHALSGIPCQTFKLELIPIFCQIIEDKRTFSDLFYEVSVILILKPDKEQKKRSKTNSYHEYSFENLSQKNNKQESRIREKRHRPY